MSKETDAAKEFLVEQVARNQRQSRHDVVTIEEPMEIRVVFGPESERSMRSLSITMRTPGNDRELAAGFLFTENIIESANQIQSIQFRGTDSDGNETGNIVRVDLDPDHPLDFGPLQRHFFTTSSCGVCGKASLDALRVKGLQPIESDFRITSERICQLPGSLRSEQPTFEKTGGLHAAGLADDEGNIVDVKEDVGRHNAVDKLIGHQLLAGESRLSNRAMVISGRASFEIMQKALVAGVPMIIAVGAPSSLAVEMAQEYQMTLVGFASADRFNIYSCGERISDVRTV